MSEAYPVLTSALEPDPSAYEKRPGAKGARKPLLKLDERGERLVELTIWGADATEAAKVGAEPGQPLSIEQAADLLGLRRKNARFIAGEKVFRQAIARELEAMRSGAKGAALRKIVELSQEPGDGSAAWGKINLQASQAILGDQVGAPPRDGANITINNNAPTLQAGIVVRLAPHLPPTPLETDGTAAPISRSAAPLITDPATMQQVCRPVIDATPTTTTDPEEEI